MSVTVSDLYSIAASVDGAPSHHRLLTIGSNPKLAKSAEYGYMTVGLMLSPHKVSGANLCSWATAGCISGCLNTSGHGKFGTTHVARIRRSMQFRTNRRWFMRKLVREIRAALKRAAALGLTLVVRLNVVSDIPWENVRFEDESGDRVTIFELFPDVQFYDYTKGAIRFGRQLPANYDLTMSDGGPDNADAVALAQSYGARVARVYRNAAAPLTEARRWVLPDRDGDTVIIDGDRHDLRFLDPPAVTVGLKAKGFARTDTTGFVRDILPAA